MIEYSLSETLFRAICTDYAEGLKDIRQKLSVRRLDPRARAQLLAKEQVFVGRIKQLGTAKKLETIDQ